jgi:hypothetical protein
MKIGHRKPVIVAAAAAAGVLAVSIGITASQSASAAGGSPSPVPSGRPSGVPAGDGPGGHGPGGPGGPGGFGGPGGHGPGGPGGQLLHGEEVVQQGTKVVTIEEQAGKVTAVSATSITVRSTDGFTATYVVSATTMVGKDRAEAKINAVKVGDTVRIEGTKTASTVTADRIMDGVPPQRPADGSRPADPNGAAAAPSPGGTA